MSDVDVDGDSIGILPYYKEIQYMLLQLTLLQEVTLLPLLP